ncbi:MAG: hypothetical protein KC944_21465, partial [Candidatus Omnitrophica bacterium]|nr:hypothetical protein [Candidatus Omnitrophota bacterium]
MNKTRWLTPLILLLLLLPSSTIEGATLYVKQDGDGTDGESWETAYRTIGEAVGNTMPNDSIWVADGTYEEHVIVEIPLDLYGSFRGFENSPQQRDLSLGRTVIDQRQDGSIVMTTQDLVLDGFNLVNGWAWAGASIQWACRTKASYSSMDIRNTID